MTISNPLRIAAIGLALLGVLAVTTTAAAQTVAVAEVEIDRDPDTLRDEIRPRPDDVDFVDTVLVFSNVQRGRRLVRCVAYDRSGAVVGRARTYVQSLGLKFMLASDLSNGRDFIGHVTCTSRGYLLPSAVLVGHQIENLNVRGNGVGGRILFPLVATY